MLGLMMTHSLSWGHVQSESNQRAKLRWSRTSVPLVVQPNSTDLSPATSASIIDNSLGRWNAVSPVQINSAQTGINKISFSQDARYFGPGVVAVTALDFSPSTGQIASGQIYLNETNARNFCFTAAKDQNSFCLYGGIPLYLGDVVSHELGHFLGLGHSEVLDSTMFYTANRGQHSPHADDVAGVRSIYQSNGSLGTISGTVLGGNRIPVFGAHVQVISSQSGGVEGATVTDENGRFNVYGLTPNASYYVYVSPLINPAKLPDPYLTVKNDFCPGTWVGSFFEQCGTPGKGHPQPIALTSSARNRDVGVVTIRCNLRLSEEYLLSKSTSTGGEQSFVATQWKTGESFVGHYPSEQMLIGSFGGNLGVEDVINVDLSQLMVPNSSPQLDVRLISAAFGSAIDYSISIEGLASGTPVIDTDRILSGSYGIPLVDSETRKLQLERLVSYPLDANPALNTFTIRLLPRTLQFNEIASSFPTDTAFQNAERPWLLWVSVSHLVNGQRVPFHENRVGSITDNRQCMDAPYTYKVNANPVSSSAINSAISGNSDESSSSTPGAGCGTIDSGDGPGGGGNLWALLTGLLLVLMPTHRWKRR